MKKFRKVFFSIVVLFALMTVGIFNTSCSENYEDFDTYKQTSSGVKNNLSVEIFEIDSVGEMKSLSPLAVTSTLDNLNTYSWGGWQKLNQSASVGSEYSAKTYAIKFSRKSGAPSSVTVRTYVAGLSSLCHSYAWNYLFESNNTQVYMTTPEELIQTDIYDEETTITGSRYAVFVFQVIQQEDYRVFFQEV